MGEISNGMLYGCSLNIISNVLCTLGYAVQKIGHVKAQNQNTHYIKQPLWISGILMIAASIPIYSFSLWFVSQTAMSMMPTLSILLIMFWSWLLLDEKLTSYDLIAISLLTPGTVIIMLSSNVADKSMGALTFNQNLISSQTLIFLSIVIWIFIFGGFLSAYIIRVHEKMDRELNSDIIRLSCHEIKLEQLNTRSFVEPLSYRWNIFPMLYLPWFAGFFCCMSTTVFKSLVNIYSDQKFADKNLGL